MKFFIVLICSFLSAQFMHSQAAQQYFNNAGQIIKEGNEITNYSQEELTKLPKNMSSTEASILKSSGSTNSADCEVLWKDVIFGDCIGGQNNLIAYDFENDGTDELIANAQAGGSWGNGNYWYILKYNPSSQQYEKIYTSSIYDGVISKLMLVDLHNDNQMELIIARNTELLVIDLADLSVIQTLDLEEINLLYAIRQVRYGDIDNDGKKELVASGNQILVVIDVENWTVETTYTGIEAGEFAIGNVDEDTNLETVFTHGEVIEFEGAAGMTIEYDFRPAEDFSGGILALQNIDSDDQLEAIYASGWYTITTFDVELESPKYEIETDLDIDAMTLYDIDNDGQKEIIYGDGQWGAMHAHSAINGNLIWSITNPNHGTTGIALGDFDADGITEIAWGSGCSSSGADNLYVHNIANFDEEWRSVHLDGAFYEVEIGDIDSDGQDEIVTVSHESESGYQGPIFTVYDLATKAIEFRSTPDFLGLSWWGQPGLKVVDYAGDGDMDIVIAASDVGGGTFYIVDGSDYSLEKQIGFSAQNGVFGFTSFHAADLDSDNEMDFIAVDNSRIHIINSMQETLEWSSVTLTGGGRPQGILTGNLDADPNPEIVVCRNYIYRIQDDYTQFQSSDGNYSAIQLYDWNEDGIDEILAGTKEGDLKVLEGNTLTTLHTYTLNAASINEIEIFDLNQDGEDEFILTSDNRIIFMTQSGNSIQSPPEFYELGTEAALKVLDYNNDGQANILLGTAISVLELNSTCSACIWFETSFTSADEYCGNGNGSITASSSFPSTTFTLLAEDLEFNNTISNLVAGDYEILATSDEQCQFDTTISIQNIDLLLDVIAVANSCLSENDGMAYIAIHQAELPLTVNWSTGATGDTLINLSPGTYSVDVLDANGCEFATSFNIEQSEMESQLVIDQLACNGEHNGEATIWVNTGAGDYSIIWDNIEGGYSFDELAPGDHTAVITDALGCSNTHEFTIDSAAFSFVATALSASCINIGNGSVMINVEEGTPPFYNNWFSFSSLVDTLYTVSPGTTTLFIIDANGCTDEQTVEIDTNEVIFNILNTPIACHGDMDASAAVIVTEGTPPFQYNWTTSSTDHTISNIGSGNYFVLVEDSLGCTASGNIFIDEPEPLATSLSITDDDPTSPELEGAIFITEVTGGTPPYFINWFNGDTLNMIDQLALGAYELTITDSNGCLLDTLIEINGATPILDNLQNIDANLFPNPNTGSFILEASNLTGDETFQIVSANGSIVRSVKPLARQSSGQYEFSFPKLTSGVYFLKMKSGNDSFAIRFVLMR